MTSARCKAFFVIPVGLTVDVAPNESKSVTSSFIAFIAKFNFDFKDKKWDEFIFNNDIYGKTK